MDTLIESFFDTIFKIAKNKKISKWIRVPFIILAILLTFGYVNFLMYIGIFMVLNKEKPQKIIVELIILLAIISFTIIIKNIKKRMG